MLTLLNVETNNATVTACLKKAVDYYEAGDKPALQQTATVALETSGRLRDGLGQACALVLVAASGHWNARYQLERAERELWRNSGPSINKAIVAFSLARHDDKSGRAAQAIAGYQHALDHARQAETDAAGMGDSAAYRRAQSVECAAVGLAEQVINQASASQAGSLT